MYMTIYKVLYIQVVLQGIFDWLSGHGHCSPFSGLGAGHPPCQLVSNTWIDMLDFMVEFYGNMIILCVFV